MSTPARHRPAKSTVPALSEGRIPATVDPDTRLPDTLDYYAEVADRAAAFKLAEEYGGTRVYLPEPDGLEDDHHLVRSLGRHDALILCKELGPGEIHVPLGPSARRKLGPQIRKRLVSGGMTAAQIARDVNCTERWVYAVKADMEKRGLLATEQDDLFGS